MLFCAEAQCSTWGAEASLSSGSWVKQTGPDVQGPWGRPLALLPPLWNSCRESAQYTSHRASFSKDPCQSSAAQNSIEPDFWEARCSGISREELKMTAVGEPRRLISEMGCNAGPCDRERSGKRFGKRPWACCGGFSGKFVGWSTGGYPGHQGQVQERAVAGYLSHKHLSLQLPRFPSGRTPEHLPPSHTLSDASGLAQLRGQRHRGAPCHLPPPLQVPLAFSPSLWAFPGLSHKGCVYLAFFSACPSLWLDRLGK